MKKRQTPYKAIKRYRNISKQNYYLIGFEDNGNIYEIAIEEIPAQFIYSTTTEKGKVLYTKFTTKKAKAWAFKHGARYVCTAEELHAENYLNNRGNAYEALVLSRFGITWNKDCKPCTEGGDVSINGLNIQVKFGQARLVYYKTMRRAEGR